MRPLEAIRARFNPDRQLSQEIPTNARDVIKDYHRVRTDLLNSGVLFDIAVNMPEVVAPQIGAEPRMPEEPGLKSLAVAGIRDFMYIQREKRRAKKDGEEFEDDGQRPNKDKLKLDYENGVARYKSEAAKRNQALETLQQRVRKAKALHELSERWLNIAGTLEDTPVLYEEGRFEILAAVPSTISIPDTITANLGRVIAKVDVGVFPTKKGWIEHSQKGRRIPQVTVFVSDHNPELGSAEMEFRYTGPKVGELLSETIIAEQTLLENRRLKLSDGTEVPLFMATLGQICEDLSRRIKNESGNLVEVAPSDLAQLLRKIKETKSNAGIELVRLIENAEINERGQAALATSAGQGMLMLFVRRYLTGMEDDTSNPLFRVLAAVESGVIRNYQDLRMAVIAGTLANKELFKGYMDGKVTSSQVLDALVDMDPRLLRETNGPIADVERDNRSVALATRSGAQLLGLLGRDIETHDLVTLSDALLIFSPKILDGLFSLSKQFEQKLYDLGFVTSEAIIAAMDVLITREEITRDALRETHSKLLAAKAQIVAETSEELFNQLEMQIRGRVAQLPDPSAATAALPAPSN